MIRAVALLLTTLALTTAPMRTSDAQAIKIPDTIEQRVLACVVCHGDKGEGLRKNEYYPRLAGKPAGYLYNQLVNFRDKRRESAIMNYMVAYLSDAYLLEIAAYYSELHPPHPPPLSRASKEEMSIGAKLVNEGDPNRKLPACTACHGKTLTGLEPGIPGLIGLYPPYITAQLGRMEERQAACDEARLHADSRQGSAAR